MNAGMMQALTGARDGMASLMTVLSKRLAVVVVTLWFLMEVVDGATRPELAGTALECMTWLSIGYLLSETLCRVATSMGAAMTGTLPMAEKAKK
jgi:hypothetical protein